MESITMLVVDDEPDVEPLIRQKFRKEIRDESYRFVFAQNGVDALAKIEQHPEISLILSDINMPEMDGLTLLKHLEDMNNPAQKAVIISAYGDMENIRTAMNRGAFDFITKPIDLNDLEVTIAKTLRQLSVVRHALREHDELVSVQRDLSTAARIQQTLLPRVFPPFPGRNEFDIFASMSAAKEVGGDFYDFFLLDEDHLAIAIGDVSGKGMPAAIFMALSRTLLKGIATQGLAEPGDILFKVNNLLIPDSDAAMFVTIFFGILNTKTGELRFSNGGHNEPYIVPASGVATPVERTGGPLVGKFYDLQYETGSVMLAPGDTFYAYTDGVNEAMDKDQNLFDDPRLVAQLNASRGGTPQSIIGEMFSALKAFTGDTPQSDDITQLALRYNRM